MPLNLPPTPLANGMRRWGYDVSIEANDHVVERCSVAPVSVQQIGLAAAEDCSRQANKAKSHCSKTDIAKPYKSFDPHTGRVWGAPNMGGRPQCSDCPKLAMPSKNRCQSCLQTLAEAVHEKMSTDDFRMLQSTFDLALAKKADRLTPGTHADTETRLHSLYIQLQDQHISRPIQTELITIANAMATHDHGRAIGAVTGLMTQHWEEHKDWLMGVKRLVTTFPSNVH